MNLVLKYLLINQHVLKFAPESKNSDHDVKGRWQNIYRPAIEETRHLTVAWNGFHLKILFFLRF